MATLPDEDGIPYEDELAIHFEDSLDLQERPENKITLVGLLIAEHEPPQSVVKEILRAIWNNMGAVKVTKAKEKVYAITVGEEAVARRLLEGNPWFIKGFTFNTGQFIALSMTSRQTGLFIGSKPNGFQGIYAPVRMQESWGQGLALLWKWKI